MRRVAQLDGVRALAALSVLVYHAGIASRFDEGALGVVTSELKLGVAVFFSLTGFLLYRPVAAAHFGLRPRVRWKHYALRRAARILPAYWVALAVLVVLTTSMAGPYLWRDVLLVQIYGEQPLSHGLGVAWSLAVEAAFYLALPLYALLLARGGPTRGPQAVLRHELGGLVALAIVALVARVIVGATGDLVLAMSLPAQLDWFLPGLLAAVVVTAQEAGATIHVPAFLRRPSAFAGAAGVAFALAVIGDGRQDLFMPLLPLQTRVAGALLGGAVLGLALGTGRPRSRALARVGLISYGIYLWHLPVLDALVPLAGSPSRGGEWPVFLALVASGTVGAVALGAASWFAIERPALAWAQRRSRPGRSEAAAPEPVVRAAGPRPSCR